MCLLPAALCSSGPGDGSVTRDARERWNVYQMHTLVQTSNWKLTWFWFPLYSHFCDFSHVNQMWTSACTITAGASSDATTRLVRLSAAASNQSSTRCLWIRGHVTVSSHRMFCMGRQNELQAMSARRDRLEGLTVS